jgi:hypothetical protein
MADEVVVERYVYGPVQLAGGSSFQRADLEVYGINHFRPSFVAHVFFNDPDVDETILAAAGGVESRPSYAGRFAVFGHQSCVGDAGHCDVPTQIRRFDDRPSHPLTRAFRRVVVTEAVRAVIAGGGALTVTLIVAATAQSGAEAPPTPLLDIEGLQVTTFA